MVKKEGLPNNRKFHLIFSVCLAIFIAAGAFIFYANNLVATLDHDSISYSLAIEKNSWTEIYHAHHLLYGYFKWVAWDILKSHGYEGRALLVNQIFNTFFGALGIGLIFLAVRYFSGSYFLGFLASVFLTFAHGYWYCSTFGGVRIMGTFFLLATFFAAAIFTREKRLKHYQNILLIVLIALLHSMAVFCHQTNIMFMAVVCTVMFFKKETLNKKILYFSVYLTLALLIVVGLYWYVGWQVFYCTTWERYHNWLTSYANYGLWGKFTEKSIPDSIMGVRALFCGIVDGSIKVPGLGIKNETAYYTFLNTSRVMLLLFAGLSFWLFKQWKAVIAGIGVWLLLYVPFFIWWEPGNMEFWLPMLPVFLILAALPLGFIWTAFKPVKWVLRVVTGLLLIYVIFIYAWYNYTNLILPRSNPENSGYANAMNNLAQVREGPEDLVVIMGWDAMKININYYFNQDYISILVLASKYKSEPEKIYAVLKERIKKKSESGHKVLIHKDVIRARYFEEINSIYKTMDKNEFTKFFSDNVELTPLMKGNIFYYYDAKPKKNR